MLSENAEALFLNGVYEDVLQEVLKIQEDFPDHILFLQPYKAQAIKKLAEHPPTCEAPVVLYISKTDDLSIVAYQAEIVGWDDKRTLPASKFKAITRIILALQPNEEGIYNSSTVEGEESVNLLHIRRLKLLDQPFSVSKLIKTSDGRPYSENRTTAGGWSYVKLSS